jgi:hypothetical protein
MFTASESKKYERMKKMNDLKNVTQVVKEILVNNEKARNSDSILYLEVLQLYSFRNGKSLNMISVPYFLTHMEELGFPAFETVRRTRQKIQSTHPELSSSDKIKSLRAENEMLFREYALSDIE